MIHLLTAAAGAALAAGVRGVAAPALLRPRFGSFPFLLAGLCVLWIVLMRVSLPGFRRKLTIASAILAAVMIAAWLPRIAGRSWGSRFLTPAFYTSVILPATVVQVTLLASLLSAPVWVPLGRWARRVAARRAREGAIETETPPAPVPAAAEDAPVALALPPVQRARAQVVRLGRSLQAHTAPLLTRRAMLQAAPWLLPGGAAIAATYGTLFESRRLVLRRVRVAVPGLPPSLHGLRIGQVTDIHIARDLTQLQHLEQGLSLLADQGLDLVVATGDLCDEPRLYLDVMRLIRQVPARRGHFSCLGNHELYVGLDVVRRETERAQVQLLADESVRLGELRLAGVSYPHSVRSPRLNPQIVPELLDDALRDRVRGETTVLLSHHPHVFRQVAGRELALTLAGHTHGGQLGFGARSVIDPVYGYARGLYHGEVAEQGQLFVSSGLGHWLPFRLGCPPEAVVIELVPA